MPSARHDRPCSAHPDGLERLATCILARVQGASVSAASHCDQNVRHHIAGHHWSAPLHHLMNRSHVPDFGGFLIPRAGICQNCNVTPKTSHPYNGLPAAERVAKRRETLLQVGLNILGLHDSPGELTLRNVCQQAGLSQRYFYESFADKDEFAAEIYDWAVQGLAASIQLAVANAPLKEKLRAGIGELVRAIEADSRVGRLLFSPNQFNPGLLHKRYRSTQLFVNLMAEHIREASPADKHSAVPFAAQFMVGGVGQILASWINGTTISDADALIESLVEFLTVYWRQLSHSRGRPEL